MYYQAGIVVLTSACICLGGTSNAADATAPAAALDMNSLFSKLLAHGIITKKDESTMDVIPDLTSLSEDVLKK